MLQPEICKSLLANLQSSCSYAVSKAAIHTDMFASQVAKQMYFTNLKRRCIWVLNVLYLRDSSHCNPLALASSKPQSRLTTTSVTPQHPGTLCNFCFYAYITTCLNFNHDMHMAELCSGVCRWLQQSVKTPCTCCLLSWRKA